MKKIVLFFAIFLIGCSVAPNQQLEYTEQKKFEKPNNVSEYTDALLIELQTIHPQIERKRNVLSVIITDYFKKEFSLTEFGQDNLKKIALILADYDKSRITIFGYNSNSSNGEYNQRISDDRANKIADIFESNSKINDLRLYVEGKSSDKKIQAEIIIVPTLK
ncbi:MAG: OmpA family protein [Alphaproteobacteria bacterium]|nr:OmpA family protein [Alphaproteobacteria bacterium]